MPKVKISSKEEKRKLKIIDLENNKLYKIIESNQKEWVGDIVIRTGNGLYPLISLISQTNNNLYCAASVASLEFEKFYGTLTLTEK